MPEATKILTCKLVEGQWEIEGVYLDLPLTLREVQTLARAARVEQRSSLRKYNLKQRALQREKSSPQLTGKKG